MVHVPNRTAVAVLIGVLCLIWGSTWIVIQNGLTDLPPFTSAAVRFATAALIMTVSARLLHRREGGASPPVYLSVVVGSTNFGISYGVVYWSETKLPSGMVSVLWASFPLMMAVTGHFFLPGEQLRVRQWLGFVLGLCGVATLFLTDLQSFGADAIPAALILLVSPFVSTIGTTVVKRHGSGVSSLLLNRNAMWIGAGALAIVAWATERGLPVVWSSTAVLGVVYLSLVGTALAFGLYFWLLRHTPAHHLSLISYVTPAIALFLGVAFGGEHVTKFTLLGTALILAGVALVVTHRPTADRSRAEQLVRGGARE